MNAALILYRLTLPEKEELLKALDIAVKKERGELDTRNREELMRNVTRSALDIMGLDEYDPKLTFRPHVVCRVLIANVLIMRGYSEGKVGAVMHKNHSTIHHLKQTLLDWMQCPNMYREELNYWNKLKQIYEIDR